MKKLLVICSLVVMLVGLTAFNVAATSINGEVNFSGSYTSDLTNMTLATQFFTFPIAVVGVTGGQGDFSPLLSGDAATFAPFGFRSPNTTGTPFQLWTIIKSGITYSFDATSLAVLGTGPSGRTTYVTVGGSGLAHITGFDDTIGDWNLTASSSGTTFTFADSNSVIPTPTPEPGTLLLLGFGLVGLVGAARKFKK